MVKLVWEGIVNGEKVREGMDGGRVKGVGKEVIRGGVRGVVNEVEIEVIGE